MTDLTIRSDLFEVDIATLGAELRRIGDRDGHDWLWDGDPAFWTGRAPLLFPIVGALQGGKARIDGRTFAMRQHGFARLRAFTPTATAPDAVTLTLQDDADTHRLYPFAFRLDVTHRLDGATLETSAVVTNRGERTMPASFGFHPALRWPLPGAGDRAAHIVRFDAVEDAPIRSVTKDGLIGPAAPSPVDGRTLALTDALFAHDALVFDRPASRGLWFGVPGRPGVRADFPDMPMLGLWTKPGAGYLCIEPWAGHADPAGYTGEFVGKPGMVAIPPGASHVFAMTLTFGATE